MPFLWYKVERILKILDSTLVKQIIMCQIEALTENQLLGMCGLQKSTQEAEDALSQGLETLNQSLSDTIIASDALILGNNNENMGNYMALAINQLSIVEAFLRQVYYIMLY